MKIIRRKSDNFVTYVFDTSSKLWLTADGLVVEGGIRALDISSVTHEIVKAPDPLVFLPNSMTYVNDTWSYAVTTTELKTVIIEKVKEISYEKEEHYVLLSGIPVPTDPVAQARITTARANVARRGGTVRFPGLGSLDLTTLTAMEDAVFDYIAAVSARYADLYDAILISTDLNLIDITTGWPS